MYWWSHRFSAPILFEESYRPSHPLPLSQETRTAFVTTTSISAATMRTSNDTVLVQEEEKSVFNARIDNHSVLSCDDNARRTTSMSVTNDDARDVCAGNFEFDVLGSFAADNYPSGGLLVTPATIICDPRRLFTNSTDDAGQRLPSLSTTTTAIGVASPALTNENKSTHYGLGVEVSLLRRRLQELDERNVHLQKTVLLLTKEIATLAIF